MTRQNYEVLFEGKGVPIKSWTQGVPFDEGAKNQLRNIAQLPFIHRWVSVMPDVHVGIGATIGSVIPTIGAIIPAAVGVDIGCGMMAVKTDVSAHQLPDNLQAIRTAIEKAVPHGRSKNLRRDQGSWKNPPEEVVRIWKTIRDDFEKIIDKHPAVARSNHITHLGTLGTGNHFVEVCLDEENQVWVMLHSGSRGVGNKIGSYFISLAKKDMAKWHLNVPDVNLSYFSEGTEHFDEYVEAVEWAQKFARLNREIMMRRSLRAMRAVLGLNFNAEIEAVNCHHNYVAREHHFDQNILVTRKGAVRARKGEIGIIPGSMGARSYIVRGLGNPESFYSCSHGAGRVMSRTEAKKKLTVQDLAKTTQGVECRKDSGVIDEAPACYKSIDAVMEAQKDLVEIVYTLKQIVCVKG